MKWQILVKPNSKRPGVTLTGENSLTVAVKAPPIDGKANEAVIEALSQHWGVPKSRITILRGHTGKRKWVEVS